MTVAICRTLRLECRQDEALDGPRYQRRRALGNQTSGVGGRYEHAVRATAAAVGSAGGLSWWASTFRLALQKAMHARPGWLPSVRHSHCSVPVSGRNGTALPIIAIESPSIAPSIRCVRVIPLDHISSKVLALPMALLCCADVNNRRRIGRPPVCCHGLSAATKSAKAPDGGNLLCRG